MYEQLTILMEALLAPLAFPFEPSRRVFWLFLLSSLLMILAVLYIKDKDWQWRKLKKIFFDPKYWLHPSSRQDVKYLVLNSVIKGLLVIPLLGSHLAATLVVAGFLQANLGDAPSLNYSLTTICIFYTLSFFVVEDFSRYALHRVMHESKFLWRFHKTHHTATVLTPLTLYRAHPVEMSLYYLRGILVFGGVSGIFVYFFRGSLDGYDILGVDLLGFIFNLLGANLRHSHIWLSFGWFEKFFISPAQHQIHHSDALEHKDKNYGTCLAIWDQLGNSWVAARHHMKLSFGITRTNLPV